MNNRIIKEGEKYIIDAGFANGGEVILIKVYGKLFCRVKDPDTGYEWDTMIYRLSNPELISNTLK